MAEPHGALIEKVWLPVAGKVARMSKQWEPKKKTVELKPAAPGTRPSRIRRDPPTTARQTVVPERDERDQRVVVIGVLTFTLAILVIIVGFSSYGGWRPSDYSVSLNASE